MISQMEDACEPDARREAACPGREVSPRPRPRGQAKGEGKADGRQAGARGPAHRLSQAERPRLLELAHRPAFARQPPVQIVPALAEQGASLAWESSFYRVRRTPSHLPTAARLKAPTPSRPPPLRAPGPRSSRELGYHLLGQHAGCNVLHLFRLRDVVSHQSVGWDVYAESSSDPAAEVFRKVPRREGVGDPKWILPSEHGSP